MGASLSLSVAESSVSQANNTSVVKATVKITTTGETRNEYSPSGYVIIDGTKYTFSHSFGRNTTTVLTTKSKTVTHNNDGSKTVTVKASFNTGVSAGTLSKTVTKALTKITRQYTVGYNANGGSGAPGTQTKVYGTTLKLSSTKPTRSGYTFQGWATSSGGSVAYAAGANYTANAAVTLYAKWAAITYSVTYNANGGSGAPGNQTKTHGTTLILSSTAPTRSGYTFVGWGTSASATNASYQPGGNYTGNAALALYAIWSLNYTSPEVNSVNIFRCNSAGEKALSGDYVKMEVVWTAGITPGVSTYSTKIKVTYGSDAVWYAETTSTDKSGSIILGPTAITYEPNLTAVITLTDTRAPADENGVLTRNVSIPDIGLPIDISPNENNITLFGVCDDSKQGLIVHDNIEGEDIYGKNIYANNIGGITYKTEMKTTTGNAVIDIGPSITLAAGSYVLTAFWSFGGDGVTSTGLEQRQVAIGTSSDPSNPGFLQHVRVTSPSGTYYNRINVTHFKKFTTRTTLYVSGMSGVAHPGAQLCGISAIRIA